MLGKDEQLEKVEAVVISHPNSGRYWVRDILHFYDGPLPTIAFTHDIMEPTLDDVLRWQDLIIVDRIPLIKLGRKLAYSNKKIVIISRDPRDVIVSYYYQKTVREPLLYKAGIIDIYPPFKGGINKFVYDEVFGIRHLVEFMNIIAPHIISGGYRVSYESLHKDTFEAVLRLLEYFDMKEINTDSLNKAIKKASFEERQKEEIATFTEIEPNARKHRKGKVGGYREELDEQTIKFINNEIVMSLHHTYSEYLNE